MARTLVIGDIHGALKALEQVIAQLDLQSDDRLVFLGDYVDGWSQSAQVIDYLIALGKKQDCLFIKGNHDAWCESWLRDATPDTTWLQHGGQATVDSYHAFSAAQKKAHLAFFDAMQLYHVDDLQRLFIHAGFASMHGPAKEHYVTNYSWDRTLWEMALVVDARIERSSKRYPKRLKLFHEIYIGHTPTLNYDVDIPMSACNVWNVDTGAGFLGKLSALDADNKQVWQSDRVTALYPGEKGRN